MASSAADLAIILRARDEASGPLRAVHASLGALGNAAAAPGKMLGGLMDGLGKIGLAGMGIQALAAGARGLGDALGVGLVNEMEQVSASINAFTKDGEKTKQILAEIRTEANSTPFGFRELASATSALMPVAKMAKVGYMDLVKQAEVLAASNPMEGLGGASFALREAVSGDFTSIIERFNLSRTTINKLKAEGVPALEIVRRAMLEMGFDSDLIAAKAQTLEGRWSTFMDTIDTVKMTIAQPIFDALKEGLIGLQGIFDSNMETIQAWSEKIATNIKAVIDIGKALFVAFTQDAGAIGIVLDKIREIFGEDAANMVQPFLQAVMELIPIMKQLVETGDLGVFADNIKEAFGIDISGAVLVVTKAFTFLTDVMGQYAAHIRNVAIPNMMALVSWLGDQLPKVMTWLTDTGWPALQNAMSAVSTWWTSTGEPAFQTIVTWLGDTLPPVISWLTDTGWPALVGAAQAVGTKFQEIGGFFGELITELEKQGVFETLRQTWDDIVAIGGDLAAMLKGNTDEYRAAGPEVDNYNGHARATAGILKEMAADFRSTVADIRTFVQWIKDAKDGIGSFIAIAGGLSNPLAMIKELARLSGQNISIGISTGIRDGTPQAVGAARDMAEAVINTTDESFDIHSPSLVFAEIGRRLLEGLGIGIKDSTFTAINSMQSLIEKLTDLARKNDIGDAIVSQVRNQLEGLDAAVGTALKQAGKISGMREEFATNKLFARPEELAFRQRMNEIDKEALLIQEQMVPLLKAVKLAEQEVSVARERLNDIRDDGDKGAIKTAEKQIERAEASLKATQAVLKPYEDQNDAIEERESALRREEAMWRNTREQIELNQEQALTAEEQLQKLFESRAKAADDAIGQMEEVNNVLEDQKDITEDVNDQVNDLIDNLGDLSFDELLGAFNVDLPGRAAGGFVSRMRPYVVGERGPELFVPGISGSIISNENLRGMRGGGEGGDIYVTVQVNGSVMAERDLAETVRRELIRNGTRNGSAMGGRA